MHKRSYDMITALIAFAAAIAIGWIDFHATEPQPAALLLIIFGAIFGFARSRSAWRWAIILGVGMFAIELIFPLFGLKPIDPPLPNVFATLIGLIPASIGTYAGVVAHEVTSSVLKHDQK